MLRKASWGLGKLWEKREPRKAELFGVSSVIGRSCITLEETLPAFLVGCQGISKCNTEA